MSEENINSGQYLEMANQLKEKFDENEKMMNQIKKQNMDLKKDIMTAYSLIKIIDDQEYVDGADIGVMVTMLRSILSDSIENKVVNSECCNKNEEFILHLDIENLDLSDID